MTRRVFTCAALGFGAAALAPAASPEEEARKVAETWLALIDQGKYGESWEKAAAMFKERIPQERWEALVAQVREPLGKLSSRSLLAAQFASELPGAPDGEYVVVQFNASFANKKNGVETVTPMKDPDGAWRVSGYQIR
jgi:hypothetical protein